MFIFSRIFVVFVGLHGSDIYSRIASRQDKRQCMEGTLKLAVQDLDTRLFHHTTLLKLQIQELP